MPLLESLLGVLLMYNVQGMRTYAALAHGARMKDISFTLEADCPRRFWLRKSARKGDIKLVHFGAHLAAA